MISSYFLLFSISLSVSIVTIIYISLRLGFRKHAVLFSGLPLLFVYLGFIATSLSVFQQLTNINFLIAQYVLLGLTLADFYKYGSKLQLPGFSTLVGKIRSKIWFSGDFITHASLFLTVFLLVTSFLVRRNIWLGDFDDKMYRASTPLYWIQNKSIFRFETVNERKNVFIMGTGLIYMWPNLFQTGEQTANNFYWLAYPLSALAVYLFTSLFTQNRKVKTLSMLIFVSTPIVMDYFTYTVVQESWLGLMLLCFFYHLISEVRSTKMVKTNSLVLGLSLGILFFLKPTTLVYLLTLVIIFATKNDKIKRLKWLTVGIITCLILSGYALLSYQNVKLYGAPFGSAGFQNEHIAQSSFRQLKTHLARSLFIFIEFPTFSKQLAKNYELWIQNVSQVLGATTELNDEAQSLSVGIYQYKLISPNVRYGIGGILLLIVCLVNIIWLFKRKTIKTGDDKKNHLIFSLVLCTIIIQLLRIRWAEASGVPYRNLLSSYVVICGFFSLYFEKIYNLIGRNVPFLLFTLILISSSQMAFTNMDSFDNLWGKTSQEYKLIRYKALTSPYSGFMNTLRKPSSFLLVEVQDALDYPLFWYKSYNRNNVYLLNNRNRLDSRAFAEIIDKEVINKQVDYLIMYNQPSELNKKIQSNEEKYVLVYSFTISGGYPVNILRIQNTIAD